MQTHLKFTRNLVAVLSLLSLMTVFGCGADPTTSSDSSSSSAVKSAESAETASNDDATTSTSESKSNFVATLLGGQTFESQKVLENQPLALWFWAPG